MQWQSEVQANLWALRFKSVTIGLWYGCRVRVLRTSPPGEAGLKLGWQFQGFLWILKSRVSLPCKRRERTSGTCSYYGSTMLHVWFQSYNFLPFSVWFRIWISSMHFVTVYGSHLFASSIEVCFPSFYTNTVETLIYKMITKLL